MHEHRCDPVGTTEIAVRLGVAEQTVRVWGVRGRMPAPTWRVGSRPVWCWFVVEQWANETGRIAA